VVGAAQLHGGCCATPPGVGARGRVVRSAVGTTVDGWNGARSRDQAVAGAVVCLWSLSKLCVALINRHSERQADLPRRRKRSQRRLNLVLAKTGSTIVWRWA
jgi:hypothetical protein